MMAARATQWTFWNCSGVIDARNGWGWRRFTRPVRSEVRPAVPLSEADPARAVVRVVDVYPYRLRPGAEAEWLLLRRAPGVVYAGQWRMVGGKIALGETAWQAALRELAEEIGQQPVRAWAIPSVNA